MPPPSPAVSVARAAPSQRRGFVHRVEVAIARAIDVVIAASVLAVTSPVLLAVGLMVRATSAGPALFRQARVGRHGEMFEVIKFRTMVQDASLQLVGDPTALASYESNDYKLVGDDPRITPIGRWLRRTSLDELPQLVNVLAGEMAIVGVRPLVAKELAERPVIDQELYCRFRPGVTGLWQVSGRSAVRGEARLRLDRQYLERWSLATDMRILLQTPSAVLRGVGAH